MENNRRNDIGSKLGMYGIIALVGILLSIFFTGTYNKAEEANARSYDNKQEISVQAESMNNIREDVGEIKVIQRSMDDKIDKLLAR